MRHSHRSHSRYFSLFSRASAGRDRRRSPARRPGLEALEGRITLSGDVGVIPFPAPFQPVGPEGSLIHRASVAGQFGSTGSPFVASGSGGLDRSIGAAFGPDVNGDGVGELYVSSFNSDQVMRYDGRTGAPYGAGGNSTSAVLVSAGAGGLDHPEYLKVGPDGLLYVVSSTTNQVFRYDAGTGAFRDIFVKSANSGGLSHPLGLTFGSDGDLYVGGADSDNIVRFDRTTGAPKQTFVAAGAGGLSRPEDLAFGPDGNLYVSSSGNHQVLRYNGTTGAFLGTFVSSGSGGLSFPTGLAFGPDGSLIVASVGQGALLRFDGATGAFVGVFAASGTAGLNRPTALVFGPDGGLFATNENESGVVRVAPGAGYFRVDVAAGQTRTITLALPGSGPGQFDNDLDPILEVLDASGNPVAGVTVTTLADGGKQVVLGAGSYRLRIRSAVPSRGRYALTLS